MNLSRPLLASLLGLAAVQAEETPIYQQILDTLKASDEVLPLLPNVAPVHTLYNAEGVVPPMCYTRTEVKNNPCYVCHQDGIDGRSPAAGGLVDRRTLGRAQAGGLPPLEDFLDNNDSFTCLNALADAWVTGPSGTNVGDLTVVLVGA